MDSFDERVVIRASRKQVLSFRARASHLDAKLPSGSFVEVTHAGLQDSAPRSAVIGLHARVNGVAPDSWEDPSLAQIWFRGGADYLIPRSDVGVFTLGCLPRDEALQRQLFEVAERAIESLGGETKKVREVADALALEHPLVLRAATATGRFLIRWNASMIWLIGNEAPEIDPEDARRELARRFFRWFGPQTKDRLAWWTGALPADATKTWDAIKRELAVVEIDGEAGGRPRAMLEADVDALMGAEPVEGVRLIHNDDPLLKSDRALVVADEALRNRVFPPAGTSPGYIPGAILVDGEVAGVWQRQQRRVTIHPWRRLSREAVEREALSFPIAARTEAEVRWEPIG